MHAGFADRGDQRASAARIYNYMIGGDFNFAVDREAAEQVLTVLPLTQSIALANRAWIGRAVRHLTRLGFRQFLDVGSGALPTVGNVHEVAQGVAAGCRVVYVDNDAAAVMYSQEKVAENPSVTAVIGDLLRPDDLLRELETPELRALLDPDQRTAVILAAVLHFAPDDEQAYAAVRRLCDPLPPGSALVISHAAVEGLNTAGVAAGSKVYEQKTTTPGRPRTRDHILRFFDGFDLEDPGLVWGPEWRPSPSDPTELVDDPMRSGLLVGVGIKR
ncbi:SAM-dependent methyltransferase [Phytohabitans kaempferiae]|uniref:SAM-dependent methyltransferase n=1 Tax=Phytohabitans kaempferiae TaxID=1620943 RepID=A0ABV6M9M0_9ACTN